MLSEKETEVHKEAPVTSKYEGKTAEQVRDEYKQNQKPPRYVMKKTASAFKSVCENELLNVFINIFTGSKIQTINKLRNISILVFCEILL